MKHQNNINESFESYAISDQEAKDVTGGLLVQFNGKGVQLDWNNTGNLEFGIGNALRFSVQDIRNFKNTLTSTGLFGTNSVFKSLFSLFKK